VTAGYRPPPFALSGSGRQHARNWASDASATSREGRALGEPYLLCINQESPPALSESQASCSRD